MEVSRILRELAEKIAAEPDEMRDRKLLDVNGNCVGQLNLLES